MAETEQDARSRLVRAELKVEAVRAGMVDLDGLKLLDLEEVQLNSDGEIENAAHLMAQLRRAKPWLFGGTSSSSPANAPPAQPPRQKLATEMTDKEYRAAALLKLAHSGSDPSNAHHLNQLKESPDGHSELSDCLAADHPAGLPRAGISAGTEVPPRLSRVRRPREDLGRHW